MGVLADPDALAGLLAVDLGDEGHHPAITLEQRLERGAALRVDVPLGGDVVHQGVQLGLAVATVEPHQRRVRPDHPPVGRRPVGPDGQEFEQAAEVVIGHRCPPCGPFAEGCVPPAATRSPCPWQSGSKTRLEPTRDFARSLELQPAGSGNGLGFGVTGCLTMAATSGVLIDSSACAVAVRSPS
jgi:hypothetical protein